MSYFPLQPRYYVFTDTGGSQLENGYIWIGDANKDPKLFPAKAAWDQEGRYAIEFPIRTEHGYPLRGEYPNPIYLNLEDNYQYSVLITEEDGTTVYSDATGLAGYFPIEAADAATLGGELPSYYATDSLVVHLAGAETITGAKTFTEDLSISKASTPAFEFNESGTVTLGRIKHNANNLYIQDANVLFTNRYDGDIASVKIRQNSTNYEIWHEGNDTPLMHLAGAETITGDKSFASGAVEIVASSGAKLYSGAGSPESAITASPGSLYLNTSGGANTTLYVKESGTGNTGWIAK